MARHRIVAVLTTVSAAAAMIGVLPSSAGAQVTAADYPYPGVVTGDVDHVHDPSMVKRPDGTYLLISTGNNLDIRTSADRTDFRYAGSAFPGGAYWTDGYTGGSRHLWAPDVSFHNGRYYLYYSASTFGSNRSAIYLATSPSGMPGTWTNHGIVVRSYGYFSDYNAIDPNLVVDPSGNWWLSFGSFWSGIKLMRLDPATGKPSDRRLISIASRPNAGGAVEAPVIVHRDGYYYLFASFDSCCQGTASTYRIMVGRSRSITGPYHDRNGVAMTRGGGTEIMASHGNLNGPGHPAVFDDVDATVLAYHHYPSDASRLGINLIDWSGGWPVVY